MLCLDKEPINDTIVVGRRYYRLVILYPNSNEEDKEDKG